MRQDRASDTAYLIAKSTYFLSWDRRLGCFVPPEASNFCREVIASHAQFPKLARTLLRSALSRALIKAFEHVLLPGVQLHYALRKRCIEELVRTSLKGEFDGLWVVAAGFDSLAFRLHAEFPSSQFVEIDHPATQKVKREVCQRVLTVRPNLAFVPADLKQQPLITVLRSIGFRTNRGNVFVFEGITMYLTDEEVRGIFRDIANFSQAPARVVFTFMDVRKASEIKFRGASWLIDAWLGVKHEKFTWGIAVGDLPGFLDALGFRCLKIFGADELRMEHLQGDLQDVALAEGECICLAERR